MCVCVLKALYACQCVCCARLCHQAYKVQQATVLLKQAQNAKMYAIHCSTLFFFSAYTHNNTRIRLFRLYTREQICRLELNRFGIFY